jgi:hypothetical protein
MTTLQLTFTTADGTPLFHNGVCFCVIEKNHVSEIITAIKKDIASVNIADKINAMFLLAKIKREGIIVLC